MFVEDLDNKSKSLINERVKELNFNEYIDDLFDSKLDDVYETLEYLGLKIVDNKVVSIVEELR